MTKHIENELFACHVKSNNEIFISKKVLDFVNRKKGSLCHEELTKFLMDEGCRKLEIM